MARSSSTTSINSPAGLILLTRNRRHDERILRAVVDALAGLPVLLVGLHLPRELAVRREGERGDRGPGGAAVFYDLAHAHAIYDLELDTSVLSPEECALRIKTALDNGHPREAFRRLQARYSTVGV
jgi:chloramphenicol 3-O phosphotransferase